MKNQKLTFLRQLEEKDKIRKQDVDRYKGTIEQLKQEVNKLKQDLNSQKQGISQSNQASNKLSKDSPYSKEETKGEFTLTSTVRVFKPSHSKAVFQESSKKKTMVMPSSMPQDYPTDTLLVIFHQFKQKITLSFDQSLYICYFSSKQDRIYAVQIY